MSDTATVLDGKLVAARIKRQLTLRVQSLSVAGVVRGLATVLVGEDPASRLYVDSTHRDGLMPRCPRGGRPWGPVGGGSGSYDPSDAPH